MGLIGRVAMVGLLAHHDWPFMKEGILRQTFLEPDERPALALKG
jgi:hypothetical protein